MGMAASMILMGMVSRTMQIFDDNVDIDGDTIPDDCDSLIDSDADGVADSFDTCSGYDDAVDVDADGIPDGCDSLIDSDGDGISDAADQCEGYNDLLDQDGDGIPDNCDQTPMPEDDQTNVTDTTPVDDGGGGIPAPSLAAAVAAVAVIALRRPRKP